MTFVPFVLGCFGDFGAEPAEAARFLYVLAFLELRQNDELRDNAELPPLPSTDRSQFRASCFRKSSTRILLLWLSLKLCVSRVLQVFLPLLMF